MFENHTVGNIYSYWDLVELIRGLIPPDSILESIQYWALTGVERDWLERVQTARHSHTDGQGATKTSE